MGAIVQPPQRGSFWRRAVAESQVRVALVAAICLLVEAVVAKNVLEVELDVFSQLAPFWVFVAYLVTGLRDRASELAFSAAIVAITVAVLVAYAL